MPVKLLISELHNFGGFFGGDTVTLSGVEWRVEGVEERTLTIDQAALVNVSDRHALVVGMLLDLAFAGERVERAALLGAPTHVALRRALGDSALPPAPLAGPYILAHYCPACQLWVATDHNPERCPLCAAPPAAVDTAEP